MSLEFIKSSINGSDLHTASEQQDQLSYFTESELQETYASQDYFNKWADRKYQTSDYFLNYVKSVFKQSNFMFFVKYMRKPLPSSKLIKNKIEPNLKRVLYAENSYFDYNITNVDRDSIDELVKANKFNDEMFYRLLYRHNDLIAEDVLNSKAYRYFIDINKVKSLLYDEDDDEILKIAFSGCITVEEKEIQGYIYIDSEKYQFWDLKDNLIQEVEHNLKKCPVNFISNKKYKNNNIVRESLFTFIREELEDYTFLSILRKMMYPNGAFPVTTKLQATEENTLGNGNDTNGEPNELYKFGSQNPTEQSTNAPVEGGILQAGSVYEIPAIERTDGSLDMEAIEKYLKFHYIPVEVIQNIDQRIKDIEDDIQVTIIGDKVGGNESAQNETQIEKGISSLENNLLTLSNQLSRIRTLSDTYLLQLQYNKRFKSVFAFYGTDWYLDSIDQLMKDFEFAPNPIERKDVLLRINQNKYKNNHNKAARQKLLYSLMPFASDIDFDKSVSLGLVDQITQLYQLQFIHWISKFEALYGDINEFYNSIDGEENTRLVLINNLILQIINSNFTKNNIKNEDDLRRD